MLNKKKRTIFESIKSKCEKKLFIINSATGVVREDCYIIRGQRLVAGVLGRDYLKQYKIKVDRGNDTLEIDGVHVQINACKVKHDAVNQTQQQSNVIM
jgi:hypothetical protein